MPWRKKIGRTRTSEWQNRIEQSRNYPRLSKKQLLLIIPIYSQSGNKSQELGLPLVNKHPRSLQRSESAVRVPIPQPVVNLTWGPHHILQKTFQKGGLPSKTYTYPRESAFIQLVKSSLKSQIAIYSPRCTSCQLSFPSLQLMWFSHRTKLLEPHLKTKDTTSSLDLTPTN